MTKLRIKTTPHYRPQDAGRKSAFTLGNLLSAIGMLFFFGFLLHGLGLFERLPPADRELSEALKRNDPEAARAAFVAGALVSRRDLGGGTYLHTAAYQGRLALAEVLVDQGLSAGVRDNSGVTPLHLAASSGHADLAAWLIREGAPVDAATSVFVERCDGRDFRVGFTPLDVARQAGHRQVVELLEKQQKGRSGGSPSVGSIGQR